MEIVAAAIDDGVKGCEEEDEGEGFKHFCKVCERGFACWRALGGHMRIHKADKKKRKKRVNESVGSCEEEVGRLNSMYILKRNPKRSWRFVDDEDYSFVTGEADPCKGFGSEHIHKEVNGGQHQLEASKQNWGNSKQNPMQKSEATSHGRSESETDNVGTDVGSSGPNENQRSFHRWMKGKRSKRPRSGHNWPIDSEQQQEEEDMANCLIMLATGSGCEAKNYVGAAAFSVTSGSATFKLPSIERGEEEDVSELEVSSTTREKPKESRDGVVKKRSKYQCKTCRKTFETYQGLGGHRASHKRVKGCSARNAVRREADSFREDDQPLSRAEEDEREEEMLEFAVDGCHKLPKVHECCICFRTFASGQALGGHKRCHLLLSETWTTTTFTSTKHQSLLDLTMATAIREQVDPDGTKMSSPALGRTFMHSLRSPERGGDEMCAYKEDEVESKLGNEIGPTVDNTLDLI